MANDFLPFGTGAGANVLGQADYAALAARLAGFSAGTAKSIELNKVWRQASVIAAMVAQFTADNSGQDVLDDGDITTLLANFESALSAHGTGRLLKTNVFTSNGTFIKQPGTKLIRVRMIGGGAGAQPVAATTGSQVCIGSGSGGGAYSEAAFDASAIVGPTTVTIGAGGTANSTHGGTTSFGSLLTAPGGTGGAIVFSSTTSSAIPSAGQGGLIGSADPSAIYSILLRGLPGLAGFNINGVLLTGAGGGGWLGSSGGGQSAGGPATNAAGFGAGAGGGGNGPNQAAQPGAAGTSSIVFIEEHS